MTQRFGSFACLLVVSLIGCEPKTSTNAPDDRGGDAGAGPKAIQKCAAGDGEAGRAVVTNFWSERANGQELSAGRAKLAEACDAGCAAACMAHAHTSADMREAKQSWQRACDAGDAGGCALAVRPSDAAAATEQCNAGQLLGCAAAIALSEAELEQSSAWQPLVALAESGCAAGDGRACAVQAWARCSVADSCDEQAIASADKAARLLPNPEIIETLAIVQCRGGQADAANATLAGACEAGGSDACGRRCEQLGSQAILLREAEQARYEHVELLLALNSEARPSWFTVLSAMDADQLTRFEKILDAFLPQVSEAGAEAKVPEDLRDQYPALVEAILRSPQVDAKKIKYWFARLPKMSDTERANLFESLRKQWWIIPGEDGVTPQSFVEDVRLRSGGLSPTWLGG